MSFSKMMEILQEKEICKVGFPATALEKYIKLLEKKYSIYCI